MRGENILSNYTDIFYNFQKHCKNVLGNVLTAP